MVTLQIIPFSKLAGMDAQEKIDSILQIVKKDNIVLLEGKLAEREETTLITKSMEGIDDSFRGIEFAYIESSTSSGFKKNFREFLLKLFLGNVGGFTVVGPAKIVKEIKKDPDKIQLYTQNQKRSRKTKKK